MNINRFRTHCISFAALLVFFTSLSAVHADNLILNSYHSDTVTGFFFHPITQSYFSVSRDGSLRTWDSASRKVSRTFQITSGRIEQAVKHPSLPQAALLIRMQDGRYEIAGIDITDGSRKFSIQTNDRPIYMNYSPQGTYLAYTLPQWNSIQMHDASNGRRLTFLRNVGGIISYFTFSRTEANIMTYQTSSGEIVYYDVRRGTELSRLSSSSGLEFPGMLSSRFLAAIRANNLVLVDVVNGRIVDSRQLSGTVQALFTDQEHGIVGIIRRQANRSELIEFRLEQNRTAPLTPSLQSLPVNIQTGSYFNGNPSLALQNYSLMSYERSSGIAMPFSAASIQHIQDIDISGDKLHLSSSNGIVSIQSDIFSSGLSSSGIEIRNISDSSSRPPLTGDFGISIGPGNSTAEGLKFVWPGSTERNMNIYTWDSSTDIYTNTGIQNDDALIEFKVLGDSILSLSRQGNLRMYSAADFSTTFNFRNVDLQTATRAGEYIVAGKSFSSGFQSPLLAVNPRTMETVPIDDSAQLIYRMEYFNARDQLFSLGLLRNSRSGAIQTELRLHTGSDLSRTRSIKVHPGEDLTADIFIDESRNRVYTTLGGENLSYWNGSRMINMQQSGNVPRKVSGNSDFVWTININGTASLWQASNGTYLGDIALLTDGSWVFISTMDGFIASESFSVSNGLNLKDNPQARNALLERYRVRIPFRSR
ncbi:hypothetical protein [Spirochaeta dissipatitropha]